MDKKKIRGLVRSIPNKLEDFEKKQLIEIIERLKKTLIDLVSEDKKTEGWDFTLN